MYAPSLLIFFNSALKKKKKPVFSKLPPLDHQSRQISPELTPDVPLHHTQVDAQTLNPFGTFGEFKCVCVCFLTLWCLARPPLSFTRESCRETEGKWRTVWDSRHTCNPPPLLPEPPVASTRGSSRETGGRGKKNPLKAAALHSNCLYIST